MTTLVGQDGGKIFKASIDQLKTEWIEMPDEESQEELLHIQDVAVDLLIRFPDRKAAIINFLRGTAHDMEEGDFDL